MNVDKARKIIQVLMNPPETITVIINNLKYGACSFTCMQFYFLCLRFKPGQSIGIESKPSRWIEIPWVRVFSGHLLLPRVWAVCLCRHLHWTSASVRQTACLPGLLQAVFYNVMSPQMSEDVLKEPLACLQWFWGLFMLHVKNILI